MYLGTRAMKLDFHISPDLEEYLNESKKMTPTNQFELGVIKDGESGSWTATLVPMAFVEQAKMDYGHDCSAEIINGRVFIHPFELASELEGKYMKWSDQGVILSDR